MPQASRKLKYTSHINMGQSPESANCNSRRIGIPFLQGCADFGDHVPKATSWCSNPPKQCKPGDVLISVRAPVGKMNIADQIYGLGRGLCAVTASDSSDPSYLRYAVLSVIPALLAQATGSTYDAVSADEVASLSIPWTSLPEQHAIAAFLDRETGRIDALVVRKRRLVKLLQEQRSSMAGERLLGGPPISDAGSGAQQGTFPRHWRLMPFRWLFKEVDHRSESGDEMLLSVSQTRGVIPQSELGDRHQNADSYVGYKLCKSGDLVVNRMWVYYGALGIASCDGMVSPDYAVFRRTYSDVNLYLVAELLRTPAYVGEMTRRVRGIGVAFQGTVRKPRLHSRDLGRVEIPVPPPNEAQDILAFLSQVDRQCTRVGGCEETMVSLLLERRQALITAAVTGQINVSREWA